MYYTCSSKHLNLERRRGTQARRLGSQALFQASNLEFQINVASPQIRYVCAPSATLTRTVSGEGQVKPVLVGQKKKSAITRDVLETRKEGVLPTRVFTDA